MAPAVFVGQEPDTPKLPGNTEPTLALMPSLSPLSPRRPSYYALTAAGFPVDPAGEKLWNPHLGSSPIRVEMIPKTQPLAHAIMQLLKLWSELPVDHELHLPVKALASYRGFIRTGAFQVKASPGKGAKTKKEKLERDNPRKNGATLYDVNNDLITIDGTVLRGSHHFDQGRSPGSTTSKNFMSQPGFASWWNSIVHGVETPDSGQARQYARSWLAVYAPPKKNDTHGLRFRRLSCEGRYNRDIAAISPKVEDPAPYFALGGYDSVSESEDEEGNVHKKKKKRKVPVKKPVPKAPASTGSGVLKPDMFADPFDSDNNNEEPATRDPTPTPLRKKKRPSVLTPFEADPGSGNDDDDDKLLHPINETRLDVGGDDNLSSEEITLRIEMAKLKREQDALVKRAKEVAEKKARRLLEVAAEEEAQRLLEVAAKEEAHRRLEADKERHRQIQELRLPDEADQSGPDKETIVFEARERSYEWSKKFIPMPLKEHWSRFRLIRSIYDLDCGAIATMESAEEQNLSLDEIAKVKSHVNEVFRRMAIGFADLKRKAEASKQDSEPASKMPKLNEPVGSIDEQDEDAAGNSKADIDG